MSVHYLIRIDDVCPTMNSENFSRLKDMLHQHDIKPIIGIIPDNADPKLMTEQPKDTFWMDMKSLSEKGWIIAQHGYRHEYITPNGGLLGINQKSEFAGLSYERQLEKIALGKKILEERLGRSITWWMAPAHSFDENTCRALVDLQFKYISDGIALTPFQRFGLTWIPQQLWQPKKKLYGLFTICLHPDTMTPEFFTKLSLFLEQERGNFLPPDAPFPTSTILNRCYTLWWRFQFIIYKTFFK